jgi:glucose/arabinose dehydrogenase
MLSKPLVRAVLVCALAVFGLTGASAPTSAAPSKIKHVGLTDPVAPAAAISMQPGYSATTVQSGYTTPTKAIWTPATSWAPSGETFVSEHAGVVQRTNLATGVRTILLDIHAHVNSYGDRGLNTIAIDPDYTTNHYLYLFYTYENNAAQPSLCKTSTLTRVTVKASGASSETTILGKVHGGGSCSLDVNGEPVGSACPTATTTDCIPSDFWSHAAGDIAFFADKTMLVSHGESANYNVVDPTRAYRAQNINSLAGKILHVTRSGAGISTNPFYNGSTTSNRSKVWSMGDRNQFRFRVINGQVIGGNVGWYQYEELEKSIKGGNGGWPCYESAAMATNGYEATAQCQAMYAANTPVQPPLYSYSHNGAGAAVIGGLLVSGNKYPQLTGKYLYGDYAISNISYAGFDSGFTQMTQAPQVLASNADGPVDFEQAPDGSIYYVAIYTGELRRIDYNPNVTCPTDQWNLLYYPNPDRSGTPTHQECVSAGGGTKLLEDWGTGAPGFSPDDPSFPADNFSLRATCSCTFSSGTYTFTGTADDSATVSVDGTQLMQLSNPNASTATASLTGSHTVSVDYTELTGTANLSLDWTLPFDKPGLHIAAPIEGAVYAPGTNIPYSADVAVDWQGQPLPPSAVSWSIQKHHCYSPSDCHVHILQTSTGLSGSFLMDSPDPWPDTDYVSVVLMATDPATGESQSVSVDVYYLQ